MRCATAAFWDNAPAVDADRRELRSRRGGRRHLRAQRRPCSTASRSRTRRCSILENNDDFGGHARRNEFVAVNGKRMIGYGGSQSLQTPSYFSPLVNKVMADIGIEHDPFEQCYDRGWCDARRARRRALLPQGDSSAPTRWWSSRPRTPPTGCRQTPLNDTAKANLIELHLDAPPDYLARQDARGEDRELLSRTTYAEFLTGICGYDPQLVTYFKHATEEYFGMDIEGTTALDAWGIGLPGFDGMDLGEEPYKTM